MAIVLTLKGGEQDFELIWDSAADVPTGVLPSSMTEEAQPIPLWHRAAGEDGNELVEMDYDDARWPLVVMMGPASDWPALLTELAILRRICQQAHAHAMGETWADEVYVEATPEAAGGSAASNTYFTVKLVEDRSGGFLAGTQVPNVVLEGIAVTLTVGIGYGDKETLDNAIRNGHMLIESATAGLAQGLTVIGTPTVTLDTTTKLIGAQSQKVVTDNSTTEGVYYQVTGTPSSSAEYVWIMHAGDDELTIELTDGADNYIMDATLRVGDTAGVSDKSYVDSDGNTWYRVPLNGSSGVANLRLKVYRDSTDATAITTFYVDGLYMVVDVGSSVPNAWADFPQVHNRNDPAPNTARYVNRFDVWGIPGDMPAWIELGFDTDNVTGVTRLARFWAANNLQAAVADALLLEGEDMTGGFDQADVSCSNGNYKFWGNTSPYWNPDSLKYNGVYHVIGRLRSDSTYNILRLYYDLRSGGTAPVFNAYVTFSVADRWQFHSMGLVDLRTHKYWRDLDANSRTFFIGIQGDVSGGAGSVRCDYILLLPASRLLIGTPHSSKAYIAGDTLTLVGRYRGVVADEIATTGEINLEHLGALWTAEPQRMNRFVLAFGHEVTSTTGTEDECVILWDSDITFSYRPRTRGFLA